MANLSTKKSRSPKKAAPGGRRSRPDARRGGRETEKPTKASARPPIAERERTAEKARKASEPHPIRATKQERVLTLLNRPEGAGIDEIMEATGWQVHSVRGFLSGTVKKKLGFELTSAKADGTARRYRIETRHGR